MAKYSNFDTYEFPSITNILSTVNFKHDDKEENLIELLNSNDLFSVTEKLDGSNISICEHWVASRRQKILTEINTQNLIDKKFINFSLSTLEHNFNKLPELKLFFNTLLNCKNDFDLILHGEWILKGTSRCTKDNFHYKDKNIISGNMYVYTISLYLDRDDLNKSTNILNENNYKYIKKTNNITILLNETLIDLLKKFDIKYVPYLGEFKLIDIFLNKDIINNLNNALVEGYCIANNYIYKFKTYQPGACDMNYIETLNNKYNNKTIIENLQSIHNKNDVNVNINKKVCMDLINSAMSKFQSLEDIDCNETNIKKYFETIAHEIQNDVDFLNSGINKEYLNRQLKCKIKYILTKKKKLVLDKQCVFFLNN